jgi:hypothetical protein
MIRCAARQIDPYDQLMEDWKPFSYLYMVIYFPDDEPRRRHTGEAWDADANRRKALDIAGRTARRSRRRICLVQPRQRAWYFERHQEAAQAFDASFTLGLPLRMTRYQFWPFVAYYNSDRIDYLLSLSENTYKIINGQYSEEALLWHGYGLLRQGDIDGAAADWNKALSVHPRYCDAERAINDFVAVTHDLTGCSP